MTGCVTVVDGQMCGHSERSHRLYCEVIVDFENGLLDREVYCPCPGYTAPEGEQ